MVKEISNPVMDSNAFRKTSIFSTKNISNQYIPSSSDDDDNFDIEE